MPPVATNRACGNGPAIAPNQPVPSSEAGKAFSQRNPSATAACTSLAVAPPGNRGTAHLSIESRTHRESSTSGCREFNVTSRDHGSRADHLSSLSTSGHYRRKCLNVRRALDGKLHHGDLEIPRRCRQLQAPLNAHAPEDRHERLIGKDRLKLIIAHVCHVRAFLAAHSGRHR